MLKGFKIRIYPTKEQAKLIEMHFDACRFIWNYMLEFQMNNYKNGNKYIKKNDVFKLITDMLKTEEYAWLKYVSHTSLQRECSDLDYAYTRFFGKMSRYPKFKSKKHSFKSYPVRSNRFYFCGKYISVEKVGKVKYKSDFAFISGRSEKYNNVRLYANNGKYYISFTMECENQAQPLNDYSMGIDLGVKKLAVVAYYNNKLSFDNINKSHKMRTIEYNIKRMQRSLSRKYLHADKGPNGKILKSNNIIREEAKLKKLQSKRSNIKDNYIHQITHSLVSKLPRKVVMEHLIVSNMIKNRHLSKAIYEQCLNKFFIYMKYKCELNGIEFVRADKFYPSSKMCSCCGNIKRDLKLSDRMYVCPHCGFRIDRDYNAAINLMRYEA